MQRFSLAFVRALFLHLFGFGVCWFGVGSLAYAQQKRVIDLDPAPLPVVPSLPAAPAVSKPIPAPPSLPLPPETPPTATPPSLPNPGPIPTVGSPLPFPVPGPISDIPYVTPPDYVPLREYPTPLLRTTITLEYLNWWVKAQTLSFPPVASGPINQPGVRVLFTNNDAGQFAHGFGDRRANEGDIDYGRLSGLRFGLTRWTDAQKVFGFQTTSFLFQKGEERVFFSGGDNGSTLIARPFFNDRNGTESALFISNPALGITGSLQAESALRLGGFEINGLYRSSLGDTPHYSYVFAGLRTLSLNETLGIAHTSRPIAGVAGGPTFLGTPVAANEAVLSYDRLQSQNRFYGAQIGLRWQYTNDRFTMGFTGKLGAGMNQSLTLNTGETALYRNGVGVANVPGGLFTVGDNRRRGFETTFSYVPEFQLDVMWEVAPNFRLKLGYNFLYWASVLRPANTYERTVNASLVPSSPEFGLPGGGFRPASIANQTDFWMHGLILGIEWRF